MNTAIVYCDLLIIMKEMNKVADFLGQTSFINNPLVASYDAGRLVELARHVSALAERLGGLIRDEQEAAP